MSLWVKPRNTQTKHVSSGLPKAIARARPSSSFGLAVIVVTADNIQLHLGERQCALTVRPLAQTARDTLAWARAGRGPVTGLTADEESAALKAWHANRGAPRR
jgi:hypothetical protein